MKKRKSGKKNPLPPLRGKASEQSRAEQRRAEQSRAEQSRAEQSRAEQSRAAAPAPPVITFSKDVEEKQIDPLAIALLGALDKLGMTPESKEAEKYFGIRSGVLQKLLEGETIRKDSRKRIFQRVQDAGIAVTADGAQD